MHAPAARILALAGLVGALVLTSCGSGTQPSGGGMMGGNHTSGEGMPGSSQGYHYSSLTCTAPAALPGNTVRVRLADMGMTEMMGGDAPMGARMMLRAAPATVPAGKVSLVAENMGWRTHEVVLLPMADGATDGQRVPGADGKIDETGSLGEASNSCAADSGEGITSGTVSWTTLTLDPGRYELVCNLKNHYANGMHQELDVR